MRFAAVIIALCATSCTQAEPPVGDLQRAIVDGELSDKGAHPEAVFIWLGGAACTGTLIAHDVILTARHCVEGVSLDALAVFFGNDPDGGNGKWLSAADTVYHPQADIALIHIEGDAPTEPVPFRRQALWTRDVGRDVRIVGFGDTGDPDGPGIKREGVTAIDDVTEDLLWVGATGSKTCFGDSGGPTFVSVGAQKFVIGVSSFVTSENCKLGASGNLRVDRYQQWIDDYVSQLAEPSCDVDAQCASGCEAVDPDCPCSSDDGYCSAMCEDYITEDSDCAGCAADGECHLECPALDPDCCDFDSVCNPGCLEPDPDCAQLGDECEDHGECQTSSCGQYDGASRCVAACDSESPCPSGFQCVGGADGGACWPETTGGCAAPPRGPGVGPLLLVVVALLGFRRRAK